MRLHTLAVQPPEPQVPQMGASIQSMCPHDPTFTKSHFGCSLSPSRRPTPLHVPSHDPCARVPVYNGPPNRACDHTSGPRDCAVTLGALKMACKGKEVASASTPSRSHTTKISNRGRDDGFPTEQFDSQIHYEQWKTMEHRGITHERIIRFPDRGAWLREFCSNFSADHQAHVFLRGRRIPFSEDDIDLPPPGEDNMFKARVVARKNGVLDMDLVYQVIGRLGTNSANNPADHIILDKKIDNAILNAQATAWHKLIIANIDPKQHGTKFDLYHAILIYVLMTEGIVNLPRIMRDVLLKRPTGNSRNFLPYPVFIARLAIRYQVPEFPRDEFYYVREQDMYCLYGYWKGEQPKFVASD
ncbi:hypothetical protein PIB30_057036 [Stylosanthes scabra]|uniref:Putative plant transposon protein domain-containing protein n=1 Tax=Stylosanthes scabra TaxID=79078 RepID=A0ABU6TJW2_9FABA|nr:hypothetical protein [Stylosanthes scabra]